MQDRPNYPYNDYNSLKDPNQQGQISNKQGKKTNHPKYYKGGSNKNNNLDEMNMNNNDQVHSYRHNNRYPRNDYQGMNRGGNPPTFKKKKGKKRDNDIQYQGNNAVEINQQMKEEYIEQNNNMNIGGNNHQNIYGKNYKKNQTNIYNNINMNNNVMNNNLNSMNMNTSLGSMNSNTNNSSTSNISNINLTPQSQNQITSPLIYNSNSPLNPQLSQQNQQKNIYVNPKLYLDNFRNKKENEQDISLKDDKSSENLSEENINNARDFQQGNKLGNLTNNMTQIDLNKAQSDFMNQQEYINQMNQKFIPQQNNFYIPYNNMNGINNIGNALENMGNLNNLSSINNMSNINTGNYPQIQNIQSYSQSPLQNMVQSVPNMSNMNAINNLSLSNFQRQFYDNSNSKIYNPNQMQPNFNYAVSQDDINMNHKKQKKSIQNKSPLEQANVTMNLSPGLLNNLNYNGAKNNFIKNPNNNINMKINNKQLSQSSNAAKNTIPNIMQNDNINFIGNQNQNIPQMLNMSFGPINNRNYYIPPNMPNMRNPHMNQGYINNNHINIGNSAINNKEFQNQNFTSNMVNNKQKYQKYNQNAYQGQKHNNMNNNQMFQKNKNVQNSNDMNNNNLLNNNIDNNNKSFGLKSGNDNNFTNSNKSNFSMGGNTQIKNYILSLNIKLRDKTTRTIKIKSLNDCSNILEELRKEGKITNEREKKLIMDKINKTYELLLTGKIYEFGIRNSTYKNLCEIYHKLNYENNNLGRKAMNNKIRFMKKNKSLKELNDILNDEKKLTMDNVRNVGSLNITF
jgi:hypothetical protein